MTADGPEHVELALVPYLRGELPPDERDAVEAHVAGCPPCRRGLVETRALLDAVRRAPAAPALDVGRFRAGLEARRRRHRPPAWTRPVPALAAAGLVAALVLLALQPARQDGDDHLAAMQETVLAARLGLLEQYPVVERLDLLEDMEVIGALDRLAAAGS